MGARPRSIGVLVAVPLPAGAVPVDGDLLFTTFAGGQNVNKVHFTYDGTTTFTLGAISNIASTPGADGLIFAPNGNLLVGGQGNTVHMVNPGTATFVTRNAWGTSSFHLALDPSGTRAWSAGIPGPLAEIPLSPSFANGIPHALTGNDTVITSIAFDTTGKAYYTASGSGGFGNFGTIDLTTFQTSRTLSGVPAAHGMAFDPFAGDLSLMGDGQLAQISVSNLTALKSARTSGFGGLTFDQGTVDGKGNIYAATNNGFLIFMDLSCSGLVGAACNFVASPFLASALDDVAPLVGPGAQPTVPEPGTFLLLALGLTGLAATHRRRTI